MEKTFTIQSRQGAAALEHPTSRHILLALVAKECSLSELSENLNLSLSLLTYHVSRLRRLELVQVASDTAKVGRPKKRYRAVAKEFLVPSGIASRSTANALAEELRRALEEHRNRKISRGTLYLIGEHGELLIKPVGGGPIGSAFEAWLLIELNPADAEQFGHDLRAIISTYASPKRGKTRPFLFHCALAPRKRN